MNLFAPNWLSFTNIWMKSAFIQFVNFIMDVSDFRLNFIIFVLNHILFLNVLPSIKSKYLFDSISKEYLSEHECDREFNEGKENQKGREKSKSNSKSKSKKKKRKKIKKKKKKKKTKMMIMMRMRKRRWRMRMRRRRMRRMSITRS